MNGGRGRSKPLRRVGSLWRPKPGSKAKGSGAITINGLRQSFVVLPNRQKTTARAPDYVLMSSAEPEADPYDRQRRDEP